jgi:hypothetical protein
MEHEIAHVLSDDDSTGFQLTQILRQHLLGRPRIEPRELTQTDGAGSQGTKYLYSPLTLEEESNRNRSVAYVPCVGVIHPALELSRWIDCGAPEARGSTAADDMIFCLSHAATKRRLRAASLSLFRDFSMKASPAASV